MSRSVRQEDVMIGAVVIFIVLVGVIGVVGTVVLLTLFIGFLVWKFRKKKQADIQKSEADRKDKNRLYREMAIHCLMNRLHPKESQKLNYALMSEDSRWGEFVRNFQIIADSIEIAFISSRKDTAFSRMESVISLHQESKERFRFFLQDADWLIIDEYIDGLQRMFKTTWRENVVKAMLAKAEKLKTEKGKVKYWIGAREIIEEGMLDPDTDKPRLERLLMMIPNK